MKIRPCSAKVRHAHSFNYTSSGGLTLLAPFCCSYIHRSIRALSKSVVSYVLNVKDQTIMDFAAIAILKRSLEGNRGH